MLVDCFDHFINDNVRDGRSEEKGAKSELTTLATTFLYQIHGHCEGMVLTYRGKHETGNSTVSPHHSDSNESRKEGHTGSNSSHQVEDKHEIGSTLHSVYAVLNRRWPLQICNVDARLKLLLYHRCWIEVEKGSLIRAVRDVFRGLGG